ncbi:uncharacterized protein TNCV_929171 [Trichonephila clavipes]|nr:uncharacterized protein TNCV_929171 [Trichonephila clavipes]
MTRHRIQAHYEQLSEFERGRIIGLKEADLANRRITCHMGQIDAAIRRCCQEWVDSGRLPRHDGSGGPGASADTGGHIVCQISCHSA